MADVPLTTLLSQVLVAYTTEFDDLAEQRIFHGTTVGGRGAIKAGGVWFTSQAMWTTYIRHIDTNGRPVREVQALACLPENAVKSQLHHLQWWSYVTFEPGPTKRYLDQIVKLTPNGDRAAKSWAPISGEIDTRWTKRFGKARVVALVKELRKLAPDDLPDSMPVVGYGNGMRATLLMLDEPPARTPASKLDLSALLSRVLLSTTLDFEAKSDISLTAVANVLRVIDDGGTPLKELPLRAGVAKEGQNALVNFLKKKGYLSVGADKTKTVKVTARGKEARDGYPALIVKHSVLNKALEAVLDHPKFVDGLRPHEGSWRLDKRYLAQTEKVLDDPRTGLPHHPMITHRGGFPDGS